MNNIGVDGLSRLEIMVEILQKLVDKIIPIDNLDYIEDTDFLCRYLSPNLNRKNGTNYKIRHVRTNKTSNLELSVSVIAK